MGLERVVPGAGEAESPLAEPGCPPRALLQSPPLRPCSPPGSMAASISPFHHFVFKGLGLQAPLCVRVQLRTSCRDAPAAPLVVTLLPCSPRCVLVCGLSLCEAPAVARHPEWFALGPSSFSLECGGSCPGCCDPLPPAAEVGTEAAPLYCLPPGVEVGRRVVMGWVTLWVGDGRSPAQTSFGYQFVFQKENRDVPCSGSVGVLACCGRAAGRRGDNMEMQTQGWPQLLSLGGKGQGGCRTCSSGSVCTHARAQARACDVPFFGR